jgi:hypothetical protein
MPLTDRLHQCPTCGEYRGGIRARSLNWPKSPIPAPASETELTFSCICSGIACPRCRKNRIRRPGSNYYDPVQNELLHVPVMAGVFGSCQECREKQRREYRDSDGSKDDAATDEEFQSLVRKLASELADRMRNRRQKEEDGEAEETCTACGDTAGLCECMDYCYSCGDHVESCDCGGPQSA